MAEEKRQNCIDMHKEVIKAKTRLGVITTAVTLLLIPVLSGAWYVFANTNELRIEYSAFSSGVEKQLEYFTKESEEIKKQLEEINKKIDRLLEK